MTNKLDEHRAAQRINQRARTQMISDGRWPFHHEPVTEDGVQVYYIRDADNIRRATCVTLADADFVCAMLNEKEGSKHE